MIGLLFVFIFFNLNVTRVFFVECTWCFLKTIARKQSHFVAPWARGYGLAKNMIDYAENTAKEKGASCVQLDIRETQEAAIQLFKSKGYEQWGSNPSYAIVEGKTISGLYFYKNI